MQLPDLNDIFMAYFQCYSCLPPQIKMLSGKYVSPLNHNTQKISAHADGGPRSRVCARETLCSAPHQHERKFPGTLFCIVTFKIFGKK